VSIIYDALKKTQKNRESNLSITSSTIPVSFSIQKKKKRSIYIITTLAVALSLVFYFFTPHKEPIKVTQKTVQAQPIKLNSSHGLVLDGLFVSDTNKVAMINHQMVRIGSVINNMTVVAITSKSVKLKQGDQVFVLSPVV